MLGPERKARVPADLSASRPSTGEGLLRRERAVVSVVEPAEPTGDDDKAASKKALAADLEGMIEGMLRTTRFATSATTATRGWTRQTGEVAASDASSDDSAVTASSLAAELAQARTAQVSPDMGPGKPRRWWIDVVLVLACVLGVLSAGYFTFAP